MPESVVAYRVIGTTRWFGGDYINARHYLEKAVAAAAPEDDSNLALRFGQDPSVAASIYLAFVLFGLSEIDRARAFAEKAVGRASRSGHMPTLVYGKFCMCAFDTVAGDLSRAAHYADATLALGREHGMPVWIAVGTFFDGWARGCAGDEQRGLPELRRGSMLCYDQPVLNWLALMDALQATAEADAGNVEAGLAAIDAFVAEKQPLKQHWLDAELHRRRGALLLRRVPAQAEAAEAAFQHALAIARSQKTKTFELRAPSHLPRYGAIRTSRRRPAISSLRSMARSPKASTRSI